MSAPNVRVIQDTRGQGLDRMLKRFVAGNHRVLVGIRQGEVARKGAFVEFGTEDSPERPFLRGGIRSGIPKVRRVALHDIRKIAAGEMTIPVALERAGMVAVGAIQHYMTGPNFAPNAPSTIRQKGSSQPTIDTGELRQSVTHVVEVGGAGGGMRLGPTRAP